MKLIGPIFKAQYYPPFGMLMPGRSYSSGDCRFGFNGKEKVDEIDGSANSIDFGARIYDSRLGRWMSVDPLAKKFPGFSPFVFNLDNPIIYKDPDGRSPIVVIEPQTFNHNVGKPIENIHQLGETNWVPKITSNKNGKIENVSFSIQSTLNYAFVEGPRQINNPQSKLNKENPGLYDAVSTHENKHAEHLKSILSDDNLKYQFNSGTYKLEGSVSEIIKLYENIDKSKFTKEQKLQSDKDFYSSVYRQVKDNMNKRYGGNEENATINETIAELNTKGKTAAVQYQTGKTARINEKDIPRN